MAEPFDILKQSAQKKKEFNTIDLLKYYLVVMYAQIKTAVKRHFYVYENSVGKRA